jgi:hypothetical protein
MQPIIPTTIEMMGCQAVANEATAAAPVIVVSVLAAESVCCIIYHKDSNYSTGEMVVLVVCIQCVQVALIGREFLQSWNRSKLVFQLSIYRFRLLQIVTHLIYNDSRLTRCIVRCLDVVLS